MTPSPLKVFALVNGQAEISPVRIPSHKFHPHTFLDINKGSVASLSFADKRVLVKALKKESDIDIVKCGIGDPMSADACEQRTFIAPKGQRHLSQ